MQTNVQHTLTPTSKKQRPSIVAQLASSDDEILQLQKLRYQIFAEEMGAKLPGEPGIDYDHYDDYCDHLIVKNLDTQEIIGGTRLLSFENAHFTEGFYSSSEFNLQKILKLNGRILEVGRTCIHADHRNGSTIAILWAELAKYTLINQFDFMIGCASIGLEDGGHNAQLIMEKIREKYLAPEHLRITPKIALPKPSTLLPDGLKATMPPLLKAYTNLGAYICGEPCWDEDFNVADVFILLDLQKLNSRYARHFIDKQK